MIGTLFGILAALLFFYNPVMIERQDVLIPVVIGISLLLFLIENIAAISRLRPLQQTAKSVSFHLFSLFKKDSYFRFINGWLFLFVLLTFLMSIYLPVMSPFNKTLSITTWIFLFGLSFDCLQYSLRRFSSYLNPFTIVDLFKKEAIKNIQEDREIDLCDSFDALSEIEVKAIEHSNPFLAIYGLNTTPSICQTFLESSKSIGHENHDPQINALGINDKVSFILSHLFRRMDFVFQEALDKKLKIVLNSLITNMGKIIVYSAKCDLTLTPNPTIQLGKFAEKSLENNVSDVGVLASCTLLEVAKTILTDIDCTYLEIKETYLVLIAQLDKIAKLTFKQDKSMNIAILIQPFLDLKELFKIEKNAAHLDADVINRDLDRVIAEFQMLETVMRTIPPRPAAVTS